MDNDSDSFMSAGMRKVQNVTTDGMNTRRFCKAVSMECLTLDNTFYATKTLVHLINALRNSLDTRHTPDTRKTHMLYIIYIWSIYMKKFII